MSRIVREHDDGRIEPIPVVGDGDVTPAQVIAALRHWAATAKPEDVIMLRPRQAKRLLERIDGISQTLRATADSLDAPDGPLSGPLGLVGDRRRPNPSRRR